MRHTIPAGLVAAAAVAVVLAASASALPGAVNPATPEVGAHRVGSIRDGSPIAAADSATVLPPAPTVYVLIPTPTPGPPTPTPTSKPKAKAPYDDTVANARLYVKNRIGVTQYGCIDHIFQYESKWNPLAQNPRSGAYGIPQAVPGSKMAVFGSNWRTSPLTQVKWGIWYVGNRYGSACDAWAFVQANGWY